MRIAVACCTYCRPKQLAEMLWCYEQQDYQDRFLVILDDARQYRNQMGDRWCLISSPVRYASLGEKRNAVIRFTPFAADYIAIWDDDDLYRPWALSAVAAALDRAEWCRPSVVLEPAADEPGTLQAVETGGAYQGSWGLRRGRFETIGGYAPLNGNEDADLSARLVANKTVECDPIKLGFEPYYIYRWFQSGWSVNGLGWSDQLAHIRREKINEPLVAVEPAMLSAPVRDGVIPRRW